MTEPQTESNEQQASPLIGDVIRKARESRNVSLKIIAQHTKISYTNLEALEASDFASLPNKAYVKGYVKSCAKLLGLNEDECLDILQANYDVLDKPNRIKEEKRQIKEKEAKESSELVLKMVGVVAAIVILVLVITNQKNNDQKDLTSNELSKEDKALAEEVKAEVEISVTPVVLSDTTPLKPEKTPAPTPTATPTPVVEQVVAAPVEEKKTADDEEAKEEDKKEVELRPITGTLYTINEKIDEDDLEEWLPSNFRAAAVDGKQNVFINATDGDTWLTYQSDDGDIKKFVLKQGQKLFITGEEILLFLGNYRVTKIFLNNKPIDIHSRSGVKSLVFPQEKSNEHFYPLFIYKDDGSVVNSKNYKASL